MKEIKDTETIGDIINSFAFENSKEAGGIHSFIKHSTIFSFWDDIVGLKFAKLTRPSSIKYSKLYVSAKSPVVIQELTLVKSKLLKKINSYSMALGIEIKDLVFDYRNFQKEEYDFDEDKPVWFDGNEIDTFEPDEDYKDKIVQAISKMKMLDESQKKKFISKILNLKKAQMARQK